MSDEMPSQIRVCESNTGTIDAKTLATAGTVPGHDRTGLEFDMHQRTPEKTSVSKHGGHWLVSCPCGYIWHTDHHRLAVLFAVEHAHLVAA